MKIDILIYHKKEKETSKWPTTQNRYYVRHGGKQNFMFLNRHNSRQTCLSELLNIIGRGLI